MKPWFGINVETVRLAGKIETGGRGDNIYAKSRFHETAKKFNFLPKMVTKTATFIVQFQVKLGTKTNEPSFLLKTLGSFMKPDKKIDWNFSGTPMGPRAGERSEVTNGGRSGALRSFQAWNLKTDRLASLNLLS